MGPQERKLSLQHDLFIHTTCLLKWSLGGSHVPRGAAPQHAAASRSPARLCGEGGGWTVQKTNVCHSRVAQTLRRKEEEGTNLFANDVYLQMSFFCSSNK